jgi:hypothetical protein
MYRKTLIAGMAIIAIPALPAAAFAAVDEPAANMATEIDTLMTIDGDVALIAPPVSPETPLSTESSGPAESALPVIEVGTQDLAISDEDLLQMRGGQAIVVGNQTLTAISNGNAFNGNYAAGNIALTDNALSNFNGLGNLVINTGAQNNLQSAMNVTINFAQ